MSDLRRTPDTDVLCHRRPICGLTAGALVTALAVVAMLAASPVLALEYETRLTERGSEYVAGSLLVRFAPGSTPVGSRALTVGELSTEDPGLDALQRAANVREVRAVFSRPNGMLRSPSDALSRWYALEVDPSADIEALAREWEAHPGVEAAEPDYLSTLDMAPSDPLYDDQWGHHNTGQLLDWCESCNSHSGGDPVGTPGFDANVEAAWDFIGGYGYSEVKVAVIDTGVDYNHPDLDPIIGYDFDDDDPNPYDSQGHGTKVAGVACALADNGLGSAGVAPGCRILIIRSGRKVTERAASLAYAADEGATVVNMSWTIYGEDSDSILEDALDYADDAEVVLVSSAGNRNEAEIYLPQCHDKVMAIGGASPCGGRKRTSSDPADMPNNDYIPDPNGVSCDGETWWGSSYGVDVEGAAAAVDLLAPVVIPTTERGGDHDPWFSGTSAAAPFVAGVVALIRSIHPDWTAAEVREALLNTATDVVNVESGPGWDRYSGYGLVNAAAAVAYGESGLDAPTTVLRTVPGDLRVVGPNPFQDGTRLAWSLERPGNVSLTVFDTRGRRVRDLVQGRTTAGEHSFAWDGRDAGGRPVAGGMYFVTLRTADRVVSRRVLHLR